jgi:hypothetical protein
MSHAGTDTTSLAPDAAPDAGDFSRKRQARTRGAGLFRGAERRFRSSPTLPQAALRRLVGAPRMCERFARSVTLALALCFMAYGAAVYRTPVKRILQALPARSALCLVCECRDGSPSKACIAEWSDAVELAFQLFAPEWNEIEALDAEDVVPPCLRLGFVTAGFTGLVFCALGCVMIVMLCMKRPGCARLTVKCTQLLLGCALLLYLGLTGVVLYFGHHWILGQGWISQYSLHLHPTPNFRDRLSSLRFHWSGKTCRAPS